jgi:hypothetical protein
MYGKIIRIDEVYSYKLKGWYTTVVFKLIDYKGEKL